MPQRSLKPQSQRQLRAGELVRRALAGLFERKALHIPELDRFSITITEVILSPDLKHARIYCLPRGDQSNKDIMDFLNQFSGRIRKYLGKEIKMKFIPSLLFQFDTSFQSAEKIDQLLNEVNLKA